MSTLNFIPAEVFALLPGSWQNQTTKDTWHFKPQKNTGYNPMEIIQSNSGIKMIYGYKTILEEKIAYIEIDDKYFQIMEFNATNPVTITLKNPAGKYILLHKLSLH